MYGGFVFQQLHKIADADRSVRDAQRRLQALDDREKKLRKDINKVRREKIYYTPSYAWKIFTKHPVL